MVVAGVNVHDTGLLELMFDVNYLCRNLLPHSEMLPKLYHLAPPRPALIPALQGVPPK